MVISQGELHSADEAEENDVTVYSFPALKMLYKVKFIQ